MYVLLNGKFRGSKEKNHCHREDAPLLSPATLRRVNSSYRKPMDATKIGPSMSNAMAALISRSWTPDENASSHGRLTKSGISGREGCAAKLDEGYRSLNSDGGETVGPLWDIKAIQKGDLK